VVWHFLETNPMLARRVAEEEYKQTRQTASVCDGERPPIDSHCVNSTFYADFPHNQGVKANFYETDTTSVFTQCERKSLSRRADSP